MQHDLSDEELVLSDTDCEISPAWPTVPSEMRKSGHAGGVGSSHTAEGPSGKLQLHVH